MEDEKEKKTAEILQKAKRLATRSCQIEKVVQNIKLMKVPSDAELRIINRNQEILPRDDYASHIFHVTGRAIGWSFGRSTPMQMVYNLKENGCELSEAILEAAEYYAYMGHFDRVSIIDREIIDKILARKIGEKEYWEYMAGQKPISKFLDKEFYLPKDEEERKSRLAEVKKRKEEIAEYNRRHPEKGFF